MHRPRPTTPRGWPDWALPNQGAKELMVRRVNEALDLLEDQVIAEALRRANHPDPADEAEILQWLAADGPEIDAAEHGDIEPLREKYSHIEKFINLPELTALQRFPQKLTPLEWQRTRAAWDVHRIRRIWQKVYRLKNRRRGDDLKAEDIAAARHGISKSQLEAWMKDRRLPSDPLGDLQIGP